MLRERPTTWRAEERRQPQRRRAIDGLVLDGLEILPVVAALGEDLDSWFDDDDDREVIWVCREVRGDRAVLGRLTIARDRLLSRADRGSLGRRS